MKKAIVVLLALAFVGVMAFADDMKATVALTGGVEGGAKIVSTGGTTTIQQYTNNEGTTGWANMNLQATLGDFSANFYLRSSDFATWIIPNAWVTEKFLNDMLEVRAGVIDNGVSGTQNKGWGGFGGTGIQVVVNPISGLSLGALLPAPLTATDISTALQTFKAGVAYTMADMFKLDLSYLNQVEFDAGVEVDAVPNLVVQIEAQIPTVSGGGTTNLFENASYTLGSLNVGVSSAQGLASGSTTVSVKPAVSYTMGISKFFGSVNIPIMPSVTFAPEVGVTFTFNGMAALTLQEDYDTSTSTNTVNVNFVHNF